MSFATRSLALALVASCALTPAYAAKKNAKPVRKPAAPAAAVSSSSQPVLLGTSKDWTAYQVETPDGKVCYAVASPQSTKPAIKGARGSAYVIISTWLKRGVKDELQIVPGYSYNDGDPITAQVGNVKVDFFAKVEGKESSAWVKEIADEATLVRAMRGGRTLTVTATPKKGTQTADTFSLSGISAALQRAHTACGK